MPVDLAPPVPEPTNPVEAGLADLWARTVPAHVGGLAARASPRAPSTCSTSRCGSCPTSTRAGSPTRSSTSRCAARWAARPGRRAWSSTRRRRGARPRSPRRRPLRVLRDTFSDGVHLRNDLFSYQREVEEEGELATACSCWRRSSAAPPRRPPTRVNDLLTSRLHQFEHTALTEVPAARRGVRRSTRTSGAAVARLRQGPAGLAVRRPRVAHALQPLHERAARTRRGQAPPGSAPTGLGTSAAGVGAPRWPRPCRSGCAASRHVPYQQVGPSPLPDFHMPFAPG